MGDNKLQRITEPDPEWVMELVKGLLDINTDDLSEHQKKMLRAQYLANLRDGLKPKDAIQKAIQIVLCFK